jgi:nucleotide-binding universal stress UspA family protein
MELGKGLGKLLRSCPRPILVVSELKSALDRALLAYDGSDQAQKALHTGAYLVRQWGIQLAVLTTHDEKTTAIKIQQRARHYLESQDIKATYVIKTKINVVEAILDSAKEQRSNFILMGAYGRNAPWYVNVGSAVTPVLQKSNRPVLICG